MLRPGTPTIIRDACWDEGFWVLCLCARNFKPELGYRFGTYATAACLSGVRRAMARTLDRRSARVPQPDRDEEGRQCESSRPARARQCEMTGGIAITVRHAGISFLGQLIHRIHEAEVLSAVCFDDYGRAGRRSIVGLRVSGMKYREIARIAGLTHQRIQQIVRDSLAVMRDAAAALGVDRLPQS